MPLSCLKHVKPSQHTLKVSGFLIITHSAPHYLSLPAPRLISDHPLCTHSAPDILTFSLRLQQTDSVPRESFALMFSMKHSCLRSSWGWFLLIIQFWAQISPPYPPPSPQLPLLYQSLLLPPWHLKLCDIILFFIYSLSEFPSRTEAHMDRGVVCLAHKCHQTEPGMQQPLDKCSLCERVKWPYSHALSPLWEITAVQFNEGSVFSSDYHLEGTLPHRADLNSPWPPWFLELLITSENTEFLTRKSGDVSHTAIPHQQKNRQLDDTKQKN